MPSRSGLRTEKRFHGDLEDGAVGKVLAMCKFEGLSLNPQYPKKKSGEAVLGMGGAQRQADPEDSWLPSQPSQISDLWVQRERMTLSQNK